MTNGRKRAWVLAAISAPLGFFVLALLIVEAFLANVLIFADLEPDQMMKGMYLGVGMFLVVTVAVFALVWARPQNLTYDKEAHLIDTGKVPFGTDTGEIKPEERFERRQVEG